MLPEITSSWQIFLFVWFIIEWVIRIGMLFIVPKDRHPSSALIWLVLILIFPTFGFLLYASFGNPKLPKVRRYAKARSDARMAKAIAAIRELHPGTVRKPVQDSMKSISELAYRTGGLPVFEGNDMEIITDYDDMLTSQAEAIDEAENYVHLAYFILVLDNETEKVFDAMERAVKRGVTVRVLFDRFGTPRYPDYKQTLKRLDDIGVQWKPMLPYNLIPGKNFTRFDLRNHRKLVIIDGKVAYTGSSNIIRRDYHRTDGLLYEDMMIKMTGPIVWQCNSVFRADWYVETGETLSAIVDSHELPKHTGSAKMQLLPSGPSHPDDNNPMLYASLFYAAKHRISIVVPYLIPDDTIMTALTAAARRGVDVTIINSEIIDKTLTGHAQRSYYSELMKAGVKIYLHKSPVFLHNKQVLIDDDVAAVGSSNLDARSLQLSLEVTMLIYNKDVVEELDKIEDRYIQNSKHVTEAAWESRPVRLQMLDSISRLTSLLQ